MPNPQNILVSVRVSLSLDFVLRWFLLIFVKQFESKWCYEQKKTSVRLLRSFLQRNVWKLCWILLWSRSIWNLKEISCVFSFSLTDAEKEGWEREELQRSGWSLSDLRWAPGRSHHPGLCVCSLFFICWAVCQISDIYTNTLRLTPALIKPEVTDPSALLHFIKVSLLRVLTIIITINDA